MGKKLPIHPLRTCLRPGLATCQETKRALRAVSMGREERWGVLTSCRGDYGMAGRRGLRGGDVLRERRMPRWGEAGCIWRRAQRGTSGDRDSRVAQV